MTDINSAEGVVTAPELPTGRWTLDPMASEFGFSVKHFWGMVIVSGTFTDITGELRLAADGAASGELRIAAASVSSGIRRRDRHLRSTDWLAADQHPLITFTPTVVRAVDDRALRMEGRLAIRGHSELIDLDVDVRRAAGELILSTVAACDRLAFGMTWGSFGMTDREVSLTARASLRSA